MIKRPPTSILVSKTAKKAKPSEPVPPHSQRLLDVLNTQFGETCVNLNYTVTKFLPFKGMNGLNAKKFNCVLKAQTFHFYTRGHDTPDSAREQAAKLALSFYENCLKASRKIDPKVMLGQFMMMPKSSSENEKIPTTVSLQVAPLDLDQDTSEAADPSSNNLEQVREKEMTVMEGSPIQVLRSLGKKLSFTYVSGPGGFTGECIVEGKKYSVFSDSRRVAKNNLIILVLKHFNIVAKDIEKEPVVVSEPIPASSTPVAALYEFCQKSPYLGTFSFAPFKGGFECSYTLTCLTTKNVLFRVTSERVSTKKKGKIQAGEMALKKLRALGLL